MRTRLRDRIFRREDIAAGALRRWTLFRLPGGRALYLHHFRCSDARWLHDHPKRFVTIGLKGGYVEEYLLPWEWLAARPLARRQCRAPWIRSFPANHIHRVRVSPRGCWTLAWAGRATRDWGFLRGNRWIHWQRYGEVHGERRCD